MKLRGSLYDCSVVWWWNSACDITSESALASGDSQYTKFLTLLGFTVPVLFMGHLTDVYLSRYRSLKWSFGFLILAACMSVIYIGILFPISIIESILILVVPIFFLVYIVGLALFQANAIQFGHQLLEAPTPN